MKSSTVVFRSVIFHVAAVALLVVFVPVAPLLFVPDRRALAPFVAAYLRALAWLLRMICGIDHRVEGRENLPAKPYLLASRHESAWEVMFFRLFFDDPVAFAKPEVFTYPLGGRIARTGGHIAVPRSGDLGALRGAFEGARKAVAGGRSVLIFPSGTRFADGRDRIQNGVGVLYGLLDVPCVPVVLDSGKCWPPGSWLKYPGTIHVRIRPAIEPGLDRRAFLTVLRERLGVAPEDTDASGGASADDAERPAEAGDAAVRSPG